MNWYLILVNLLTIFPANYFIWGSTSMLPPNPEEMKALTYSYTAIKAIQVYSFRKVAATGGVL